VFANFASQKKARGPGGPSSWRILQRFDLRPGAGAVAQTEEAVVVEMARGARRRGLSVIAVTSVAQSEAGEVDEVVGARLLDEADVVIDLCTPAGDALSYLEGLAETPVGPGSTLAAVAIADAIKVRTAELLVAAGKMPPVITSAAVVGRKRSEELFDAAYKEYARRASRTLAT